MAYFSGQGRVFIGARDTNGNPQGLVFVGNVPDLKVSLSVKPWNTRNLNPASD